jgi:glyoxylase-like metal-dependent hydrolase (beta-lactamase superfamily II)
MFNTRTLNSGHLVLNRRRFMGVAAALIAAGALPKSALALAGPQRFTHGAFDLTVLSDGQLNLPLSIVSPQATIDDLKALMGAAVQPGDMFTSEINVVLARTGSDLVLFDTGAAGAFGPTAGQLFESLKAAGVDPADITKVIFTHAHPDHILGAIGADGKPTFANASFHMAQNEFNFWSPADLSSKVPAGMKDMTLGIQAALAVLGDRLVTFKAGAEVLPGIGVFETPGHTPGHVAFELAGGDGLVLIGDSIPQESVFFKNPEWTFGFDYDGTQAGKSRRTLLDMAATTKKQMLGYHWAYPGLGRAEAKDGAFVYVPADL